MKIAFSPCPNDTFVFHAWVHGLIPDAPVPEVTYADIEVTNRLAAEQNEYDVLKISFAALPWVLDNYALLPCGGALGRGCGPLILTGQPPEKNTPAFLEGKRIAVPSDRSTAYLLFRLWAEQNLNGRMPEVAVMPFHQIMPAVRDKKIDAGLVIHEARFTYRSYGLTQLADLGEWWEQTTGMPIPLGAIVARRSLPLNRIKKWIRESVQYAWRHPGKSQDYVMRHAQELSPDVAKAHIDLYVNAFTENLGVTGYRAVDELLSRSAKLGLLPEVDPKLLHSEKDE